MALHAQPAATAPAMQPVTYWRLIGVALVTLCGAVSIASFVTSDPTHNDFERFANLRLLFLFFALFAGLCAAYVAAYRQRETMPYRRPMAIFLVSATLLLVGFPVGSKDVLGYAFLGRMWGLHHANPYVVAPTAFSSDAWAPFLAGTLGRPLSVYGPLFLWQSWLINFIAGDSLWVAIWLHKAVAALLLVAVVLVARGILSRSTADRAAPASWLLLLLAWNPLLLFEAAASAHNDIAMLLLLLAALACWQAGRVTAALALLMLSFWYKLYGIIFIPVLLIETLKTSGLRAAIRHGVVCAVIGILMGAILLAPLSGALPAIVGGVLHPEKMRGIFPNELSPLLAALFWALRAAGAFTTDRGFRIFDLTRFALFGGALVAIYSRQWRAAPSFAALTESCFLTGLAFFILLITQLWPWHLLTVIVLGILCGREPFVAAAVVLTVLALLSYFLTFAVATVMLGLVAGVLWAMRRISISSSVHSDPRPL
jgi:hypothetical protein